jgi:hypothetical protein
MASRAEAAIAKLRNERDETLRTLLSLPEPSCRLPARWAGTDRTVNFLLRMFTSHQMDHMQQLQKMLRDREHTLTEPQVLLMRAQAMQDAGRVRGVGAQLERRGVHPGRGR